MEYWRKCEDETLKKYDSWIHKPHDDDVSLDINDGSDSSLVKR